MNRQPTIKLDTANQPPRYTTDADAWGALVHHLLDTAPEHMRDCTARMILVLAEGPWLTDEQRQQATQLIANLECSPPARTCTSLRKHERAASGPAHSYCRGDNSGQLGSLPAGLFFLYWRKQTCGAAS